MWQSMGLSIWRNEGLLVLGLQCLLTLLTLPQFLRHHILDNLLGTAHAARLDLDRVLEVGAALFDFSCSPALSTPLLLSPETERRQKGGWMVRVLEVLSICSTMEGSLPINLGHAQVAGAGGLNVDCRLLVAEL